MHDRTPSKGTLHHSCLPKLKTMKLKNIYIREERNLVSSYFFFLCLVQKTKNKKETRLNWNRTNYNFIQFDTRLSTVSLTSLIRTPTGLKCVAVFLRYPCYGNAYSRQADIRIWRDATLYVITEPIATPPNSAVNKLYFEATYHCAKYVGIQQWIVTQCLPCAGPAHETLQPVASAEKSPTSFPRSLILRPLAPRGILGTRLESLVKKIAVSFLRPLNWNRLT